jgi:hypothetical protein
MAVKMSGTNGFELFMPTSGGKAGKGRAKTSSLQVRRGGVIVKQFRFTCDDEASRRAAVAKAVAFMHNADGGQAT